MILFVSIFVNFCYIQIYNYDKYFENNLLVCVIKLGINFISYEMKYKIKYIYEVINIEGLVVGLNSVVDVRVLFFVGIYDVVSGGGWSDY